MILRAEGLTKRFDTDGAAPPGGALPRRRTSGLVAVEDLSFEVRAGEIFGFLGPNGAGKTTTLRLLAALIAPTSGTAEIAGYRLGREDDRIRAVIGILPEQPGLYERMSALENLEFYARLYGLPADARAERVAHFLRLLGLWERRDDPVATFSRGMKQKVAIARAALHEPRILFLDEPTTGLDPDAAKTVRDLIVALRDSGRTVFLCTHNLDEADRLCDRIALFRRRLLRLDTPANLRRELYGSWTEIRLAGARPEHLRRIRSIAGVRSAALRDGTLRVESDEPARTNPAVVRALVESGVDVTFVIEGRPSLEEVYLKVMGRQA